MLPNARTIRDGLVEPPQSDEARFEAELAALKARARRRQLICGIAAACAIVASALAVVAIATGHDGEWDGSNLLFDLSVAVASGVLLAIAAACAHSAYDDRRATSSGPKSRRPRS
ncbi:MAG TPA: hypothetical protein VGG28_04055 [Kofleriaceae bacterium]|jgi:peptidoglycan/LPS O-acetylase OafA/YrhL